MEILDAFWALYLSRCFKVLPLGGDKHCPPWCLSSRLLSSWHRVGSRTKVPSGFAHIHVSTTWYFAARWWITFFVFININKNVDLWILNYLVTCLFTETCISVCHNQTQLISPVCQYFGPLPSSIFHIYLDSEEGVRGAVGSVSVRPWCQCSRWTCGSIFKQYAASVLLILIMQAMKKTKQKKKTQRVFWSCSLTLFISSVVAVKQNICECTPGLHPLSGSGWIKWM